MFTMLGKGIRYRIRYKLGKYPWIFFPLYNLIGKKNELAVSKKTDVCIEGYPRMANTFFVVGVRKTIKRNILIAHHLHVPAQIIKAVKNDIPAILLIRSPIEAISSHILRNSRLSYRDAIEWYISFYKPLIPLIDKILVIDFTSIVNEPQNLIEKAIKFCGYNQSPIIDIEKEEIYEEIERLDKIDSKKVEADFLTISRPQKERGNLKNQVQKKIRNEYSISLNKAEQVYKEFEKHSY